MAPSSRKERRKLNNEKEWDFTVFLGIYNGSEYLKSLLNQITSQTDSDFKIVVVDNNSEDDSWEKLQEWKKKFGERLVLLKNENNLGGGGSLALALRNETIKAQWFTSFHQDDYYLANHIEVLKNEIQNSSESVVAICTSMGSLNEYGQPRPAPPRANWLLTGSSPADSFLLNLRTQALSWPSTAFKTDIFKSVFKYWHSPIFSDTETTLKLCGLGDFVYLPVQTMLYRENPKSESHVVNHLERQIGTTLGLIRVFNSTYFINVLDKIDEVNRSNFVSETYSSIDIRLDESPLKNLVKITASEAIAVTWDFCDKESNAYLAEMYNLIGSRVTSEFLSGDVNSPRNVMDLDEISKSLKYLSNSFGSQLFKSQVNKKENSITYKLIVRMPLNIRIKIFRMYARLKSLKQPNFYWDAFWK